MPIDPKQLAEWKALALEAAHRISQLGSVDGPLSDSDLEAALDASRVLSSEVVPSLLESLEQEERRARAALEQAAEVTALRGKLRGTLALLRELEWVAEEGAGCPACGGRSPSCAGRGHAPDCPLGLLLRQQQ
jgi:hypothetical protein